MPIYDYTCGACGHTVEVIHGIHDGGPRFCPSCGVDGRMKKAFNAPTIHFKGSGWAKKDRSATATSARSKSRDGASSGDTTGGPAATDATAGSTGPTGPTEPTTGTGSASRPAATTPTAGSTTGGE